MRDDPFSTLGLRLARIAYDAYCESVGGKAFNGDNLPPFDDVPQRIKNAWLAAVNAVTEAAR